MASIAVPEVAQGLAMRGFEVVDTISASTYRDSSTVMACASRGDVPMDVVRAWHQMIPLLNQRRAFLFCAGAEVADAYNQLVARALQERGFRYLLTLEDDCLPPADAHHRLLDAIGDYDAIGGLYFRKTEPPTALLLGDPSLPEWSSLPIDPCEAIEAGAVVPVNVLPMGCTLYKLDLFREMEPPWFQTTEQFHVADQMVLGRKLMTHDVGFSKRAKALGKRFAIHCGVRVGHLNVENGVVY